MKNREKNGVEYAAWLGMDWGHERHAVTLEDVESGDLVRGSIEQTPEALHRWLMELRARFGGRVIALAIEQSKGAVINFLLAFDFVHVFRINPKSLSRYRDALSPTGAKDDPTDADLLMQFLKLHVDRLRPWVPDDPHSRALQRLVEFRRKTVDARTALTNMLTQALREYFPQALEWAGKLNTVMACDFLTRWPTLEKVQRAKVQTIERFYREHGLRRSALIQDRCRQVREALPLTNDPAVIDTSILMVRTIIAQLRALIESVAELDRKIEALFEHHPDFELFSSFPGAGAALAPRLQAAMGSNRDRFEDSQDVQEHSGIAPVISRSGKHIWIHFRWACPKFVRQSFHEFAASSRRYSVWAQAFYDKQRAKGKDHHAAVRSLAFKWIRIIYRCWLDRAPYDENRYLAALRRRGVDYLPPLTSAA